MATITDHGLSATMAMDLSIAEDRTVRLKWSNVLEADLLVDCDDSSDETLEDGSVLTTYWGGDASECVEPGATARQWSVALVGRPAEAAEILGDA